jgi:alkylation response protein AidB-like acyl-CoA dehydrogenase
MEPNEQQRGARAALREYVDGAIVPHADRFDREERMPPEVIEDLARRGYLGAVLPAEWGGLGMDMGAAGVLNEEVGRGCSSLRSLLTVHGMVSLAVLRWGSREQKERWLRPLAAGEVVAAFALTEPEVGSDARSVATEAAPAGDSYLLSGRKKWITFGQIADLFLVFAQSGGQPCAFLVERDSPGLGVRPISGMLGVRGSMLAELTFEECRVPKANMVGRVGFGFSYVASSALDYGRYSVACGCVGIGQACLEACLRYTSERRQFGAPLGEHQLVQQKITRMLTEVRAARLLCQRAGHLKDRGDPGAIMETSVAKYFASRMATRAAGDAVQLHGANGCSADHPVGRYLRDARVMEIIEGSTQMQEITIARMAYQEWGR